ncbi:ATP synthase mitochondrial F1 complex assembly factor 1-like [Mizuhopecten yessoensis]|uniref:ATP synthase mitochondrial F1 complex assembly factor 1 n=1 Tax=Mizuhopecten yessoensis TaxID=6573 RepID=A0A210QC55_MIZYE|nr:ATP synthase mitochondrial F1 complex assembly factor 1-like [Mizuhopecten yessoensis]XP_021361974.1 ATP synthase mitochondrial F1 complex assembly factor 1-like [Mizuhopecten yessoensis]OWF46326.1 ATP synthase mitochondrial F1 complex assembly factor 1 [Mizuhopecten yessoensis]
MNYSIDTGVMPRINLLRVCLSCWSRLPNRHISSASSLVSKSTSIPTLTCSPSCGLRWPTMMDLAGLPKKPLGRQYSNESAPKQSALELEQNAFFEKYRHKLKQKQSEAPEEYHSKLEEMEATKQAELEMFRKDLAPPPAKTKGDEPRTGAIPVSWPPNSLNEIMKMDLLKDKTPEEITHIWKEYHVSKDCVFGVVKEMDYEYLMEKSRVCPVFVYPLPRQDGFEFILSQFNGKEVFFTPLIMYQTQKESALSCLTLTHFQDLQKDKGIVLMAGQYNSDILTKSEALILVKQMTMYYCQPGMERFNLVRLFNHMPEKFHYQEIISEYKKMKKMLEMEV